MRPDKGKKYSRLETGIFQLKVRWKKGWQFPFSAEN
jgi:hypothetical protein